MSTITSRGFSTFRSNIKTVVEVPLDCVTSMIICMHFAWVIWNDTLTSVFCIISHPLVARIRIVRRRFSLHQWAKIWPSFLSLLSTLVPKSLYPKEASSENLLWKNASHPCTRFKTLFMTLVCVCFLSLCTYNKPPAIPVQCRMLCFDETTIET